jgi:hypothetical protein
MTPDEVVEIAREHRGYYLLANTKRSDPTWEACRQLVREGRAIWIGYGSKKYPGIMLREADYGARAAAPGLPRRKR